ncbi:MAG TPA: hypothetical protein VLX92_23120 [Kofleriaceae bacterium]|nr:hypothetical protein [Kofleriaceae bacterium]
MRRIPVDVLALVAIACVLVASHLAVIGHGMCFNDPAWYFHFGRRVLHGDTPYRDFVFQVGPLPIYVDAAFQRVFGEGYLASLYAGLFIKILRVFAMWLVARRLAGRAAAALACLYCGFDLSFTWSHHWSIPYAQLLLALAGLGFVIAARAPDERRACRALAAAGLCAGLVFAARQSTCVMTGVVLVPITAYLAYRGESFTRARLVALWAGFAAGIAIVLVALAALGALGPALHQMLLDAPQKKSVHGLATFFDPISGGALTIYGIPWWRGFLFYLALPCGFVAAVVHAASRRAEVAGGTVAVLAIPAAIVVALYARFASFDFFFDVPRTLLTTLTAFAVLAPDRLRAWFGLEPLAALGLGTLAVASDWASELSFPGRGWGQLDALVPGVLLVALASSRVAPRGKRALCAGFAALALVHVAMSALADVDPFARDIARDGQLADNHVAPPDPLLRGMQLDEARARGLAWLEAQVPRGSTCFVYGNDLALYDLLGCANPTRIDTTIADFLTADDAADAIAALRAHPPDFLIAQERSYTNPSLELAMGGELGSYSPLNPEASRVLHTGLRELLPRYESVGVISDIIGPDLDKQIYFAWDTFSSTRLYRRTR